MVPACTATEDINNTRRDDELAIFILSQNLEVSKLTLELSALLIPQYTAMYISHQ